MIGSFTAVIVDANPEVRRDVGEALRAAGVTIAAEAGAIESLGETLMQGSPLPRLVLVSLDQHTRAVQQCVTKLVRAYPATHFIAMSRAVTTDLLRDAMDAGFRGFIPIPLERARLIAVVERARGDTDEARRARIVHVIPTTGGCGATTIACAVAEVMAKLGKTLIIDLDLVRGAVANGFNVRQRHSIADVCGGGTILNESALRAALAVHRESGLSVLARPEALEDAERVTREGLMRLLDVAGSAFDFIVVDSTMALDPLHAAAARAADVNVLVMQLNVPSAKNTERYLHALRRTGLNVGGTSQVVVNRFAPERADIQPTEVERALGLKIAWMLPNDFSTAMGAINFGEPVTQRFPRTVLSRSIVGLAQQIAGRGGATLPAADPRYAIRS